MSKTFSKTASVDVAVVIDLDDVIDELDQLSDEDLRGYELMRVNSDVAQHHEALFAAAERGDCTAVIAAAEQIAWTMYGRILTGKVAA